jgi:hypothetical protein
VPLTPITSQHTRAWLWASIPQIPVSIPPLKHKCCKCSVVLSGFVCHFAGYLPGNPPFNSHLAVASQPTRSYVAGLSQCLVCSPAFAPHNPMTQPALMYNN